MIRAEIVADSVSPEGIRLTTFALTYPRFIHSEFMTHRVFSRNASSSRAVPSLLAIISMLRDPAEPFSWGRNQPGMQADHELNGFRLWLTKRMWHTAKWCAAGAAYVAAKAGAHKQVVNRIIEPWSHITVLVTSTDWANFFHLRYHSDADPTFQALAREMHELYEDNAPNHLDYGQWHLPYVLLEDYEEYNLETLKRISAARCARVSYLTHDKKKPSLSADLKLFDRLMAGDPKHASPTEHQATPDKLWSRHRWAKPQYHGNFHGWVQFRKTIPGEAKHDIR